MGSLFGGQEAGGARRQYEPTESQTLLKTMGDFEIEARRSLERLMGDPDAQNAINTPSKFEIIVSDMIDRCEQVYKRVFRKE